ncbi:unnamed protein product [Fructobacillus evanidus]|uniref:Uncharacterized protein n=1 Tax=Fructobacillus tropaeoli TaxID=709323 RepID=A0ABN9YV29_9LACO|nr:unnamed protein product [Fructobacillus sp. LMG 32999]CAK1241121.1 unnamed protein product [Fructobacillus tropaeoli]
MKKAQKKTSPEVWRLEEDGLKQNAFFNGYLAIF